MLEFNSYSTEKKSELLWEWGYYVTHFRNDTTNIVLFSLGSFLAEVHYTLPENTVDFIKGLGTDELPLEFFNHIKSNPFVKMVRRVDAGNHIKKSIKDPFPGKD
jgi:hypothetical protein